MPKTTLSFYLHMIAVAVIVFALGHFFYAHPEERAVAGVSKDGAQKESVYDRVMRTGTIRCGYGIFPPVIMKDPNTGQISGANYEIIEEIGKQLNLKIEWSEEVDWGQIATALQSDRIDMMCSGLWGTPQRSRGILFSQNIFLTPVQAFVRTDDHRFDNDLSAINDSKIKIATNDGDVSEEIAVRDFPSAQRFAKSQIAGESQLFMNVITNKADVTFSHISYVDAFNTNNKNPLRMLTSKPLRIFPVVFGIKPGQLDMKNMIDSGITYVSASGISDSILDKFFAGKNGWIMKAAKPYQLPAN